MSQWPSSNLIWGIYYGISCDDKRVMSHLSYLYEDGVGYDGNGPIYYVSPDYSSSSDYVLGQEVFHHYGWGVEAIDMDFAPDPVYLRSLCDKFDLPWGEPEYWIVNGFG